MAGFFSINSKPYRFMCRLTDLVKLNLLWVVFSLPVVTIGASTIAMSAVALRMAEDAEGHVGHDFIKAFKDNLRQGIPMTFITAICLWAVWMDFQLFRAVPDMSVIFLIAGVISAYVFTLSLVYVFPLLARYSNSIINSLKNSFRISMKFFLRTLLLLLIVAVELGIMLWNTKTMILILLVGPAFLELTVCSFAIIIFRKLEEIPGTITE